MSSTEQSVGSIAESAVARHIANWRKIGFATAPADRNQAQEGIRRAYESARLRPPRYIVWVDSPWMGSIAAAILAKAVQSQFESVVRSFFNSFSKRLWNAIDAKGGSGWWREVEHQITRAVGMSYGNVAMQIRQAIIAELNGRNIGGAEAGMGVYASQELLDRLTLTLDRQLPGEYTRRIVPIVERGLTSDLANSIMAQTWYCGTGSMDGDLAFYDFCRTSGFNFPELGGFLMMAQSCGWWWPFEDICIATERPKLISVDAQGRLHYGKGPAILYPDHWRICAWHGTFVPARFIKWTRNMNVHDIMTEPNIEVRRMMLDIYGLEAFMLASGAQKFQEDECGALFRQELGDDEPIVTVRVRNSTPEPDGHFKYYFLRVPPNTMTAREGVAWTFGLSAHDYHPKKET
ncbi:MAG TPA: hypothetical protein V6D17_19105 [Candidatus Obscuribacterales bacterium]